MIIRKKLRRSICALVMCAPMLATSASADALKWQHDQYQDEITRKNTATLTYGIPETDAVQVRGVCEAPRGASAKTTDIIFATDLGNLRNGSNVQLQFSGGGKTHILDGVIAGVGNTEERVAGVRAKIQHSSPFWDMLQNSTGLDYFIPGYRISTLDLSAAHQSIRTFLRACKQRTGVTNAGNDGAANGNSISEKEAFAIAKDLGTKGAWQAFLNNFPTGFRADLARAYVARLDGTSNPPQTGTNQTPGTPQVQPPTPGGSGTERAGSARPVFINAGNTPWWNAKRRVAYDGGRAKYTASVSNGPLELVTFCHRYGRNRDLTMLLREAFPDPGSNLSQALRSAATLAPRLRTPGAWDNTRQIGVTFSNGASIPQAATNGNDLQKQFYLLSKGRSIKATDQTVGWMMSERNVRISAPNLDVTFQLTGSRAAICSVLKQCGVRRSDCRGVSSGSQGNDKPITTKPRPNRCSGGRYFSKSRQACRCPSRRPVWNGVSCERAQKTCGKNFRLVNGKCVVRQNCGVNAYRNVEGDCFCKRGFELRGGKCRTKRKVQKCTRGRIFSNNKNRCACPRSAPHWYGGRCRPVRDCPGDSELINGVCRKVNEDNGQDGVQNCGRGRTWVGGQGRCVCIDSRKRWNGKRCVVRRKKNTQQSPKPGQAKETACNVLKLACVAGSNSACRQVQKQGC